MFETRGNDIYVSRGEAAVLNVSVFNEGEAFEIDPLEKLRFTVYDLHSGAKRLELESEGGSTAIDIKSEHTAKLNGALRYAVKFIFGDGSEATIIGDSPTFIPRIYVMEA